MNINEIFGRLDKLFAENRISEVERYLTQALSEAEYDGDRETMQAIYNELISFHRSTGEYDKALYFCRQVMRLAKKVFRTRKKTVLRPMFFRRTELPRLVMLEMMLKISSGMTTAETTWA